MMSRTLNPVVTLSRSRMLELWRLARHLEPLRTDAAVTRTDAIDLDRLGGEEIDRWYEDQLLHRPFDQLPLTELADEATVVTAPDGAITVTLPERCLRVASAMVEGWRQAAVITTDLSGEIARRQSSEFLRGGACSPVGVVHPGGRLMLYSVAPGSQAVLTSLVGVARPTDPDTFILTRSMLPESIMPM